MSRQVALLPRWQTKTITKKPNWKQPAWQKLQLGENYEILEPQQQQQQEPVSEGIFAHQQTSEMAADALYKLLIYHKLKNTLEMHVTKRNQCIRFFLSHCCVIYAHKHRNWFTCVFVQLCVWRTLWRWTTPSWCHSVCRYASVFLHSIIITAARAIVAEAISGSGASRELNGKRRRWNQGVNVRRIISTFTHNWEHTVWLLGLMKSLWLCVWPQ